MNRIVELEAAHEDAGDTPFGSARDPLPRTREKTTATVLLDLTDDDPVTHTVDRNV